MGNLRAVPFAALVFRTRCIVISNQRSDQQGGLSPAKCTGSIIGVA
jgi:hypothetical protein